MSSRRRGSSKVRPHEWEAEEERDGEERVKKDDSKKLKKDKRPTKKSKDECEGNTESTLQRTAVYEKESRDSLLAKARERKIGVWSKITKAQLAKLLVDRDDAIAKGGDAGGGGGGGDKRVEEQLTRMQAENEELRSDNAIANGGDGKEAAFLKEQLTRMQAENEELRRKQRELEETHAREEEQRRQLAEQLRSQAEFKEPVTPSKILLGPSTPLRGMGASKSLPSPSNASLSRGAQALKLLSNPTAEPSSPIKSPAPPKPLFGISALQTVVPVAPSSILSSPTRDNSRQTKRRLLDNNNNNNNNNDNTMKSTKLMDSGVSQGEPSHQLLAQFKAVETVLALHRSKLTTPWWSSVAQASGSFFSSSPLPLDLVRVVNGILENCWPPVYRLRQSEDEHELPSHFELVVEVVWKSGTEEELQERRAKFERALAQALRLHGGRVEALPRAALPVKPLVTSSPLSLSQRLGIHGVEVSNERRQQLAEAPVSALLAHVDPATLLAVRLRQEEARLVAETKSEAMAASNLQKLTHLVEQIRSCCRVNKRWRWPLDVFANKLLDDPRKQDTKEALVDMLKQLQILTDGWVTLAENDRGALVAVAKDIPRASVLQALEKLKIQ